MIDRSILPKKACGEMRTARIKIAAAEGEAVYHCMSRTVNGEHLFDDSAKEIFRKQLWQIADYCGVQVLTYAIMSNHFHVLLRVPLKQEISDEELLRRYRIMYPKPTTYQLARVEVIAEQLKNGGTEADAWRKRQTALMGDVSQYMKLVKQRFSVWFNRTHKRYGTLWSERFKSVLVEGRGRVLETMAAYIDLNCVRAGLAEDPKDYRFCGYGEAVGGGKAAQRGLLAVVKERATDTWPTARGMYRETLFGKGSATKEHQGRIAPEELEKVLKEKGQLSLSEVLRCRVRYFTDGAMLGSHAFVREQIMRCGKRMTPKSKRKHGRSLLPVVEGWGDLATFRGLRKHVFG